MLYIACCRYEIGDCQNKPTRKIVAKQEKILYLYLYGFLINRERFGEEEL
jgi:hypothetical protein